MRIRFRVRLFRKEHASQNPQPFEHSDSGAASSQNPRLLPHQASDLLLPRWKEYRRSRLGSFSASLCLHVLLVFALVSIGRSVPPIRAELALDVQTTTIGDHDITWYQWSAELPPILPVENPEAGEEGRPTHRQSQKIVANDTGAQSNRQMIWSADSPIELQEDIAAPNLVALSEAARESLRFEMEIAEQLQTREALPVSDPAPLIEATPEIPAGVNFQSASIRPPQPPLFQVPLRELSVPAEDALTVERPPEIEALTPAGPDVAQFRPTAPLRFWMNARQPEPPAPQALGPAGRAPLGDVGPTAFPLQSALLPATRRLRFRMPAHTARAPARSVLGRSSAGSFLDARVGASVAGTTGTDFVVWLAQARMTQLVDGHGPPRVVSQGEGTGRPSGGIFGENPAAGAIGSTSGSTPPFSPGGSDGGAPGVKQGGSPELAVVGINPDRNAPFPGPGVRQRGRFSTGPDGGDGVSDSLGAGKGPGDGGVVRVPRLSVTPPPPMVATFGQGGSMPEFGSGYAIAFNPDRTLAQPKGCLEARGVDSRPVKIGERLDILAKGLGRIRALNESFVQDSAFVRPATKSLPKVYIGGVEAAVLSSGWSLEFTGVDEVSVIVPEGVIPGDEVVVLVELEEAQSRDDVTIAVAAVVQR